MSTYTWPDPTSAVAYAVTSQVWTLANNQRMAVSPLSGAVQTVGLPGARWKVTQEFPQHTYVERARLEAILLLCGGVEHRMKLWDFSRPAPRGTINLTGVTMSAAAQFANTVTLNGCGNATTLRAGDWIGVTTSAGFQCVQVMDGTATATSGGVMSSVTVRPALRGSVTAGAAVTLDKPMPLFVMSAPELAIPRGGSNICPPFSVDFIEVFS